MTDSCHLFGMRYKSIKWHEIRLSRYSWRIIEGGYVIINKNNDHEIHEKGDSYLSPFKDVNLNFPH